MARKKMSAKQAKFFGKGKKGLKKGGKSKGTKAKKPMAGGGY